MITDLNRLKAFYYACRFGGISAAARELYVTQSAVSQSIANLERETATALFNRAGRKLVLTAAGRRLFETVSPLFSALEDGLSRLQAQGTEPSGILRVGAPVEFGSRTLAAACAGFQKKYPAVEFALTLAHPSLLLARLMEGELDFAFADIFSSGKKFVREYAVYSMRHAASEKLILAGGAEYVRRNLSGGTGAQKLLACRFLDYNAHAPAVKGWLAHHYGMTGAKPRLALCVESVQAIITAVKSGMGLGVVPEYLLEKELKSGEVVKIKTRRADLVNNISLVRLKGGQPSPAEKAFSDYIFAALASGRAGHC